MPHDDCISNLLLHSHAFHAALYGVTHQKINTAVWCPVMCYIHDALALLCVAVMHTD